MDTFDVIRAIKSERISDNLKIDIFTTGARKKFRLYENDITYDISVDVSGKEDY